jgi:hypothetical protein
MKSIPLAASCFMLLLPAVAAAQDELVTSGDTAVEDSVEDTTTEYRGRFSTSGVYYKESALSEGMNNEASPNALLFTDLRMKAEALHIEGTGWDGLADLRVRYATNELAARGYVGGQEFDLKEIFVVRRLGTSSDLSVGRMMIRDVDATAIDGARVTYRPSERFELGVFGGLYPNPFSRTFGTDYRRGETPFALPLAAGLWTGYRFERMYGAVGVAGILSRDEEEPTEPNRAFVTAQGYWRVKDGLDIYHYLAGDVVGAVGTELINLQLGAHWRPQPRLLVEGGVSHMSTYAIQIFLRDLSAFETADAIMGNPFQNNLALIRTGSDEVRGGANYGFLEQRIDLNGELRIRRRGILPGSDEPLPPELAALPVETQIDVQAGVRQRKAVLGVDLGASVVAIRGDRTNSNFLILRATRAFMDDRLQFDLDGTYTTYADTCDYAADMDPTCMGTTQGQTIRAGMLTQYRHNANWVVLADYHYSKNASSSAPGGAARTENPPISANMFFFRGQYSF